MIEKYLQAIEELIVDIRVELAATPKPLPEATPDPELITLDNWLKNVRNRIESGELTAKSR